jgi:hypothetical protein
MKKHKSIIFSLIFIVIFSTNCQNDEKKSLQSVQEDTPLTILMKRDESSYASHFSDIILTWTKYFPGDVMWIPRPSYLFSELKNFEEKTVSLDKYGGNTEINLESTGFFHAKKYKGRWWIVDPEGHPWYSVGIGAVRMNKSANGEEALKQKFGTIEKWSEETVNFLWDNSFNCFGGSSDPETLNKVKTRRIPYFESPRVIRDFYRSLGVSTDYSNLDNGIEDHYKKSMLPVFHPDFRSFSFKYFEEKISHLKEDPYLLGYFSDNEIPFSGEVLYEFLKLEDNNPERIVVETWLSDNNINRQNDGSYIQSDLNRFCGFYAETYFKIAKEAIMAADPNHMYLGSRLHRVATYVPEIWKAAGKYVDVIAYNMYREWTPPYEQMDLWSTASGKPFMITEWYAKGEDSGLANTSGAGWLVKTQKDRALFYQNFSLGLMETKNCVGWHWFKCVDNNPGDTSVDPSNRDSNKGVVTFDYKPYTELLDEMKRLNDNVYQLIDYFDKK